MNDFSVFQCYCVSELYKQIIDVENAQLPSGDGLTGNMVGFYATSGVLSHDAATDIGTTESAWDSLEKSNATLRTGPAPAAANLLVLHPDTWSAIRRVEDSMNRFMVAARPQHRPGQRRVGHPGAEHHRQPTRQGTALGHVESRVRRCARSTFDAHRIHRRRLHPEHRAHGGRRAPGAVYHETSCGPCHLESADVMSTTVVNAPYQVVHNGTVHGPGAIATVPDDVAARWISHGWVTPAPRKTGSRSGTG